MNYSIIIYIIGVILKIEAAFMALPAVTALIYRETSGIAFRDHNPPVSGSRISSDP